MPAAVVSTARSARWTSSSVGVWQPARPLAPRQRIHLELQALRHAAVGLLLLRDLARLVVHDHRAQQIFVDAVEAAAHTRGADAEREILLDVRRLLARALLVVPEAREGLAAGHLARLLMLPGEEPLVDTFLV